MSHGLGIDISIGILHSVVADLLIQIEFRLLLDVRMRGGQVLSYGFGVLVVG